MPRDFLQISRRRKRRWTLIKWVSWIAVVVVFLGVSVGAFYIPALRIRKISLAGFESINSETIRGKVSDILSGKYFYLIPKNNILFLPSQELNSLFNGNLRIEKFLIEKSVFSGLSIHVSERKTWAIWCAPNESCYLADQSGFVFANAPGLAGSAILKIQDEREGDKLGQKFLPDAELDKLKYFIVSLPGKFGEEVSSLDVKPGGIYHLILKSGWYIIIDSELKNREKAFDNLVLTLGSLKDKKSELEYVDLRFEDKVFYRLKGRSPS